VLLIHSVSNVMTQEELLFVFNVLLLQIEFLHFLNINASADKVFMMIMETVNHVHQDALNVQMLLLVKDVLSQPQTIIMELVLVLKVISLLLIH
jgi:hypothetical protein